MLIKLTKIGFATSGYGPTKKVEQVIKETIWLNPTHIAELETKAAPADHPDTTTVTWGAGRMGNSITVLETPLQIITLISELNQ
tara:strand:+ start:246 stop:497 length:252 start_codon:yes stop_codon:yes gene_type:complete